VSERVWVVGPLFPATAAAVPKRADTSTSPLKEEEGSGRCCPTMRCLPVLVLWMAQARPSFQCIYKLYIRVGHPVQKRVPIRHTTVHKRGLTVAYAAGWDAARPWQAAWTAWTAPGRPGGTQARAEQRTAQRRTANPLRRIQVAPAQLQLLLLLRPRKWSNHPRCAAAWPAQG